MKRSMIVLAVLVFIFSLSTSAVMAQPIDYCEGNFDNDLDQDGTDAFVFKQDFGRSSLLDPCPQIECQTAEELGVEIEQLKTQVAQLTALLQNVSRDGNDITFSGVNVHIVDGSGDTGGTINGLGNLVVGYNETRDPYDVDIRTGSHNIVVGTQHNYSSYGGLVAGSWNATSGPYASVSGGVSNIANGISASVSGGAGNTASGEAASVSGGIYNQANGYYASVSGGYGNTASGDYTSVMGGSGNTASYYYASVSGGIYNEASGYSASVSGGFDNEASGYSASVSGGIYNEASGDYASVSGGYNNIASGYSASVSGGVNNQAIGAYSFVGGGGSYNSVWGNYAFADYSAILGGAHNTAGDPNHVDTAIGQWSTVSGGRDNIASGTYSNVSGGGGGSAAGVDDWVAGGLWQDE